MGMVSGNVRAKTLDQIGRPHNDSVRLAAEHAGPVFLRAGRMKAPIISQPDQRFEIGKGIALIEGSDVTLIATGLLVAEAIKAQEKLESEGISARVIDIHTVKPLDR